jgi:hypothetical protein
MGVVARSTKRCPRCGSEKSAAEFHKNRASHDGLHSECKACRLRKKRESLRVSDVRFCPSCKLTLPKASFGLRKRGACPQFQGYCRSCRSADAAAWHARNPDRAKELRDAWRKENPERANGRASRYRSRMKNIPAYRLRCRIGCQLRNCLTSGKESRTTTELVGYSMGELKTYIERQFLPGMCWENIALWHIDHIVPVSSFEISGPDDPNIKAAWALTNLRPLWARDNLVKKDKRLFLI